MIGKDITIAALVRAFFKYYVTGLLETQTDVDPQERFEPKNLKSLMLNHYGSIGKHFNQEAFYALSRLNYEADEVEQMFIEPHAEMAESDAGEKNPGDTQ